jgi:hypothetical protein
VVGLPTGVVPAPRPILDERWSLARAFSATPGTLAVAGGVLLAVLVVLGWLLGMTGRDRRPGGVTPAAGTMVESAPPGGIRPAQAGLLVDEVVKPLALTATLVDLAVRGYLRIEELPDHPGRGSTGGWSSSRPPMRTCLAMSACSLVGCSPPAASCRCPT